MNKNPLISVIIPAYNHERYVQEAIISIIVQTYKNLELIIINDGSSDATWNKILEMKNVCEERFVHIDFSMQENKGIGLTLNSLIEKARGEYVFFIASDDKAAPDAIEKEYAFLSENPDYALAVGTNEIIDKDGKRCFWDENRNIVYTEPEAKYLSFTDWIMKNKPDIDFFSDDFGSYKSLMLHNNHIPNGYLIRKAIMDKIKFTPEAPLEDYYLMIQISKYSKMKYIPDTLFFYRWHGMNTILNENQIGYNRLTQLFEINQICPDIVDWVKFLLVKNAVLKNDNNDLLLFSSFLYYDTGNGFNEIEKITSTLSGSKGGHLNLTFHLIEKQVCKFRIDFLEGAFCEIEDIHIFLDGIELFILEHNGLERDGKIIFPTIDPWIILDVNSINSCNEIKVEGSIKILDSNSIYQEIILPNDKRYYKVIGERDAIFASRSWRITKPMRAIGAFIRKNRLLYLMIKCLLSVKRHGIMKTL